MVDTIYVLSGRTDENILTYFNDSIAINESEYGFFPAAVGKRIYDLYGNQLLNCVNLLKNNHHNSGAVVNMFLNHPTYIGQDCTLALSFSVNHEKKLDMNLFYRSIDIFTYFPNDIFLHSNILSIISSCLNIPIGRINCFTPKLFLLKNISFVPDVLEQQKRNFENFEFTVDSLLY